MKKSTVTLYDSDSNYVLTIESALEVFTKDIKIIVPNKDGTLVLVSDLESLRESIKDGTLIVGNADKLDNKHASEFANNDLSNVISIPDSVVARLKGDKGEDGINGTNGINGIDGSFIYSGTSTPDGNTPGRSGIDFYLNINNSHLYKKSSNGSWVSTLNLKGDRGEVGAIGLTPNHEWSGTSIRFQRQDGTYTGFVDLKGAKGDKGDKGSKGDTGATGLAPAHAISSDGYSIRFQNPNGTWGSWTNIRGEKGEKGDKGDKGTNGTSPHILDGIWYIGGTNTGVRAQGAAGTNGKDGAKGDTGATGATGPRPAHQWSSDALSVRFQNQDGTWGSYIHVKGDKGDPGAKGDKGDKGDTGATGSKGDDGNTGPVGTEGSKIIPWNGDPTGNNTGARSGKDYVLDTAAGDFYEFTSDGVYFKLLNIIGPKGPTGETAISDTAKKLVTARRITVNIPANSGYALFDGSGDISINTACTGCSGSCAGSCSTACSTSCTGSCSGDCNDGCNGSS